MLSTLRIRLAAVVLATAPLGAAVHAEPKPQALADPAPVMRACMDAQGGAAGWQGLRYLRFDWVVERGGTEAVRARHLWDRSTGNYRVEWKNREGQALLALFNVGTKAGQVWVDGAPAPEAERAALLERAYGRFINDTYWLLMPSKLSDPGVHVEHAGTAAVDGRPCDLLHLTFDRVGLTPGDNYWAYVDQQSHLMIRWAFFLQGDKGTPALENASVWDWKDWQKFGTVMMARDRRQVGGDGNRIHFPVLAALPAVDAKVFTDPAAPLPGEPAAR